jgi:hypothetical protein
MMAGGIRTSSYRRLILPSVVFRGVSAFLVESDARLESMCLAVLAYAELEYPFSM